jgi:hypothetical protein
MALQLPQRRVEAHLHQAFGPEKAVHVRACVGGVVGDLARIEVGHEGGVAEPREPAGLVAGVLRDPPPFVQDDDAGPLALPGLVERDVTLERGAAGILVSDGHFGDICHPCILLGRFPQ